MAFMHGMLHLLEPLAPRGQRKLANGVDFALLLVIAVDALGKDKVRAVVMPSPYTADISHPITSNDICSVCLTLCWRQTRNVVADLSLGHHGAKAAFVSGLCTQWLAAWGPAGASGCAGAITRWRLGGVARVQG